MAPSSAGWSGWRRPVTVRSRNCRRVPGLPRSAGRGPDWPWAAVAAVELLAGDAPAGRGEAEVQGWWSYRDGGTFDLAPGPKALAVTWTDARARSSRGWS